MTSNEFGKQPKRQLLQTLIPTLPLSAIHELEAYHNVYQREIVGPDKQYAMLNINYSGGMLEIHAIHNSYSMKLICTRESIDEANGPPRYELSMMSVGTYDARMMRPKVHKLFYNTPREPEDSRISPARIEAAISALSHITEQLTAAKMPDIAVTEAAFKIDDDVSGAKVAPARRLRAGRMAMLRRH